MRCVSSGTQRMEFGEHGYMNLVPGKLPGHTEIENEKCHNSPTRSLIQLSLQLMFISWLFLNCYYCIPL